MHNKNNNFDFKYWHFFSMFISTNYLLFARISHLCPKNQICLGQCIFASHGGGGGKREELFLEWLSMGHRRGGGSIPLPAHGGDFLESDDFFFWLVSLFRRQLKMLVPPYENPRPHWKNPSYATDQHHY